MYNNIPAIAIVAIGLAGKFFTHAFSWNKFCQDCSALRHETEKFSLVFDDVLIQTSLVESSTGMVHGLMAILFFDQGGIPVVGKGNFMPNQSRL
ncbi:MAG: hypothetical protein LBH14_01150 [Desulfobulbaceae bacterium]|nr:hypothetical protein [Desulfobulbaceae bacterium]